MTNKNRIAKIDWEVANSESGSHGSTYMTTADARFLLDRIAKLERLAEAVRVYSLPSESRKPWQDVLKKLAACEEEDNDE